MRKATIDDVPKITDFIYDQFSNLEYFLFLTEDIENAEELMKKIIAAELPLFINYGDIQLYGDPLIGIISSIPSKEFTLFRQFINSLSTRKVLKAMPKTDRKRFMQKIKFVGEIHHPIPWHKKISKNSYYIAQIAVAKEAKGTGLLRKMLTPILEDCQKKQIDIVLETLTEDNVPIYQHFDFELVEQHHSANVPFDEYCFIKKAR